MLLWRAQFYVMWKICNRYTIYIIIMFVQYILHLGTYSLIYCNMGIVYRLMDERFAWMFLWLVIVFSIFLKYCLIYLNGPSIFRLHFSNKLNNFFNLIIIRIIAIILVIKLKFNFFSRKRKFEFSYLSTSKCKNNFNINIWKSGN